MSFPPLEKPSCRFRVLLRRDSEEEVGVKSTSRSGNCDIFSHGTTQNCTAMSRASVFTALGDANGSSSEASQRYGGAIVRVSELRKNGGLTPFPSMEGEGTCGGDSNKERNVPAAAHLPFCGSITNTDNKGPGSRALITFACSGAGENVFDGSDVRRLLVSGRGKRREKTKRKDNTKSYSSTNNSGYAKSRGSKVRRGGTNGNTLELQTNGELYSYRWYTKNGRRQLHYGSRTYTGRTAHQIWGKIKTVIKSKEASLLPLHPSSYADVIPLVPPRSSRSVEPAKQMNGVKRSRVETTIGINSATKPSCSNAHRTNQTTLLTPATGLVPSTVRPKLLLDDYDESLYKGVHERDVVVVSDSEDSGTCSSVSSALSSWPSLQAGSSELTINDEALGSQCSLNETDQHVYKGYQDNNNNRMGGLDYQNFNSSPSVKLSHVFEHDGWLYPTELLPLFFKGNSTGNSLPLRADAVQSQVTDSETSTKNAKLGQHIIENENNNVQGITFLGTKGDDAASSLLSCSVEVLPSVKNAAYWKRYEEMNALIDLPIEEVGDLLVTGEEIGGMRFAY